MPAGPLRSGARPVLLAGGVAALSTTRGDGDFRLPADPCLPGEPGVPGDQAARTPAAHRRLVDREWALPRQVHGASVVVLEQPNGPLGREADAVVTAHPDAAVAVLGADCALVGFASPEGVFGVAHAGWRGLLAGVLEATVAALMSLGAGRVEAVLGPCIHPECYAFSEADLAPIAERLGPSVRGITSSGVPALDLPGAVDAALARVGVPAPRRLGGCTGCSSSGFSHRARQEVERHALVLWRPGSPCLAGPAQ